MYLFVGRAWIVWTTWTSGGNRCWTSWSKGKLNVVSSIVITVILFYYQFYLIKFTYLNLQGDVGFQGRPGPPGPPGVGELGPPVS